MINFKPIINFRPIWPTPLVVVSLLALVPLTGCSKQPDAASPAKQAPPVAQAPQAPQGTPGPTTPGQELKVVTGTVTETIDASTYTYVHLKAESDDLWVATGQVKVAVGDRIVVPLETQVDDFYSPSLKRNFPVIYFATYITREGEKAPMGLPPGHNTMGRPAAAAPQVTEKIAPPEGGQTIASVWAGKATLAGKTVTVRGKVVKFNGGILDRNWIHIQDGSGSASDGSNDLTVTTSETAKVGDVITATGTIAVNRDFGAGYSYAVILEGAKIVVK